MAKKIAVKQLDKNETEVVDALRVLSTAHSLIKKFEKSPQMVEYRKAQRDSVEARDIIDGIVNQYMYEDDDNDNNW